MKKYIDGKVCTLSKIEIDNISVFIKESCVNNGSKQADFFNDVCNFDEYNNPVYRKKTENVSNWDDFGEPMHYKKSSKVTIKKDNEPVKLEKLSIF